ncbi:MAG: hypothetical protein ACREYE_10060 [Gammaproteobacteria bacterium]
MVVTLFLDGVQPFSIGVIGKYLGRVFSETTRRPLYFVIRSWRRSIAPATKRFT